MARSKHLSIKQVLKQVFDMLSHCKQMHFYWKQFETQAFEVYMTLFIASVIPYPL